MSIGYDPKNQNPAKQALKVEELIIKGSDYQMYSSAVGTPIAISSNTLANPSVVTTAVAHGLVSGQTVVISGSNSTPVIDGSRVVTVISPTTFSVPVNVSAAGTAGSIATANLSIMILEPVNAVYTASIKVDVSNSVYQLNQANIVIADSNGGLSGYNFNTHMSVSDQGIIQLNGYPSVIAVNDVISLRYRTQANLNTPTPTQQ